MDHDRLMSNAFILQQSPAFGPGRLPAILNDFGIPVRLRKLYAGDEVPTDLDEIRLVVALGGPMRVTETDAHPFLAKEVALLQRMVAIDRPVLGIGLGAQLLAHAAGAKVTANPAPEFGWHPLTLPFPGGTEPMVMGLADGSPMFHWHFDTFELPRLPNAAPPAPSGSALLCSSRLCKNQAFRFKTRLFGFQFHMELLQGDIDAILSAGREELTRVCGEGGETQIRQATEKNFGRYRRLGDRLIGNFVQFTKTY
jgi:GMP synthase (glutamine-hydrolysing)